MKKFGIERQTKLIAVLPLVFIAALLETYFIYARFDDLNSAFMERSQLLVRQLAASSEYPVFSGDLSLLRQQLDSAAIFQDVYSITVFDAAHSPLVRIGQPKLPLATSQGAPIPQILQDNNIMRVYEPIRPTQIRIEEIETNNDEAAGKPLGMVVVEFSKSRLNSQKTEIVVLNLLVTFVTLSVTLLLALRVARNITTPILGMRKAIVEIGEGALDMRISPMPQVKELHDLADGINNMARQLKSDRSMLEERIRQATTELRLKKEEAERASSAKTRFLAAASHDLRQPMHALGLFIGELHAIVNTLAQRKVVVKIEESVQAMSGLLNSLLDISKLDAGVIVPQPIDFSIDKTLERVAQNHRAVAQMKSIQLRVTPCHAIVHSDPVLLERILANLVSNAIRYTPAHGKVMVACRKRGGNLLLQVRDSGIGIPAAEQKNIFQEFVQLANKERDRSMGLGLGLAIVDRLSRLLGYTLEVASEPGRGSTFSVVVPMAAQQLTDTAAGRMSQTLPLPSFVHEVTEASDSDSTISVLVVDDDPLVRSGTEGILQAWGYSVRAASNLEEVRSQYAGHSFDLIICDYRLPDGTGLDLPDSLGLSMENMPPCILVSGDTSPDVLARVTSSGFSFLSKPVKPAKLRSLMQFLLSENSRK